jgi:hypothetical protein
MLIAVPLVSGAAFGFAGSALRDHDRRGIALGLGVGVLTLAVSFLVIVGLWGGTCSR